MNFILLVFFLLVSTIKCRVHHSQNTPYMFSIYIYILKIIIDLCIYIFLNLILLVFLLVSIIKCCVHHSQNTPYMFCIYFRNYCKFIFSFVAIHKIIVNLYFLSCHSQNTSYICFCLYHISFVYILKIIIDLYIFLNLILLIFFLLVSIIIISHHLCAECAFLYI